MNEKQPMMPLCAPAAIDLDLDQTPEVQFFIDGLLPEGAAFLNAPPKGGKSRLLLQMALELCNGGLFMGRRCRRVGVLYLPLEDARIDYQNRLRRFLNGQKAPTNLYALTGEDFSYNVPTLENGQLDKLLEANLQYHPDIRVILIDVFGIIRSERRPGEDFTAVERRDVLQLVRLAERHHIAVVVAHHVSHTKRRSGETEAVGSGAGSYVLSATIQCEYLLRKSADGHHVFTAEGRRIPRQEFAVVDDFPRWRCEGDAEIFQITHDPLIMTVKQMVKDGGGHWRGSGKEIVDANQCFGFPQLGRSVNKNTFTAAVRAKLERSGLVYRQVKNGSGVLHDFKSM